MDDAITYSLRTPESSAWARAFAAIYDVTLWAGERAGMRAKRKDLLAMARGRTLEIGAGTGLNLRHYPADLAQLTLAEPDPAMRARLQKRVSSSGRPVRVIDAAGECLPVADHSVDTLVSTLVLCTVETPAQVLREIARVLRPDGQVLLIEHVRSDSRALSRWQDRLDRPWRRFARGCRCNRSTPDLIAAAGFDLGAVDPASWRAMPPILRPLVVGRATPLERSVPAADD